MVRLIVILVALISSSAALSCEIADGAKKKIIDQMCLSPEYKSYSGSGANCLRRQYRQRAEDTGAQVALARLCGFGTQANELEKTFKASLPYVVAFTNCIDGSFDARKVFEKNFKKGVRLVDSSMSRCDATLREKIRARLPVLISMGRKNVEKGKAITQKLRINVIPPDVEAQQVFGAFEFFCLEQLRSQERIPELLETVGAVELPADQAAKFLAPQSGRAWMMRPTGEVIDPFIIVLTDTAACTVMAPKAKAGPILALFQEHTRNRKIHEEKIGSQVEHVFAVSHNDQFRDGDAHAVVMISTSQLFGGEGVIINAIPEAALAEAGIRVPPWPK